MLSVDLLEFGNYYYLGVKNDNIDPKPKNAN